MSAKVKVQSFGRFLSGMVMPNIGAFIAWGLITALFIPAGWIAVVQAGDIVKEALSQKADILESLTNGGYGNLAIMLKNVTDKVVGPGITYLLPLLIGYTGGEMIYGKRGGVVGAIATLGVIAGSSVPMFMGAMIAGPLGGYIIKKFDDIFKNKIPSGFEMLVNNFSAGILGGLLLLISMKFIGPIVEALSNLLSKAVEYIVAMGVLPLVSIIVEPAKVFFLNNAINHGVFTPLGTEQASEVGRSIYFLIETNPGPGLGILLAYWLFGKGMSKSSAPGAAIIHFFGGIHEIYFPYVLMNPALFLAVIAGGMTGVFVNTIFSTGLVAPASPGSIFALMMMAAPGTHIGILLSVLAATVVSCLVAMPFVRRAAGNTSDDDLEAAKQEMINLKGKESSVVTTSAGNLDNIKKIVVACDAGMGSSAMGASLLQKKVREAGQNIEVKNYAINDIPDDADLIITHKDLTDRAKAKAPNKKHMSLTNFMDGSFYDGVVSKLGAVGVGSGVAAAVSKVTDTINLNNRDIVNENNVFLNRESKDKYDAIREVGRKLVDLGYVNEDYINGMVEREDVLTTYLDNGVAIPHGVAEAKEQVLKSGVVVLQYPNGVDFGNGNVAKLLIGIAGKGDDHMDIISNLAPKIEEDELMNRAASVQNQKEVYEILFK